MNMKTSALMLTIAAGFAYGAYAQDMAEAVPVDGSELPAFADIDADSNGSISASEAAGTWLAEAFTAADTNEDGSVDEEEYKNAMS